MVATSQGGRGRRPALPGEPLRRTRVQHEDAFLHEICWEWARPNGWLWHHERKSYDPRKGNELRTAADGQDGWLDVTFVRPPDVIHVETKWGKNKATRGQRIWLAAWRACGQRAYIWTPDTWVDIIALLTTPVGQPLPPPPLEWLRVA